MKVLSEDLLKVESIRMQQNRPYNQCNANFEHARLCIILVPLRDKSNLRQHPKQDLGTL